MIRNENGLLTGYVYVDIIGRDANGYVQEAAQLLREKVKLPPGYSISWSGQYEASQRAAKRLIVVVRRDNQLIGHHIVPHPERRRTILRRRICK